MGGRGQGCGSPGEKGAGGVRETGEERAASAREIEKCKLSLFVTAYIQRNCLHTKNVHTAYIQRNEPNNVFRLLFNVLRGLKQNFIGEKSQKTKIRNRDLKKKNKKKKTALLPLKLETFPSRLHHSSWMRWQDTCTRVSTVSVVSVSLRSR